MVSHFREQNPEKLNAYGSNNYFGFRGQAEGEDFYVTCRIGVGKILVCMSDLAAIQDKPRGVSCTGAFFTI